MGYRFTFREYECQNCNDWLTKSEGARAAGYRSITVNPTLNQFRDQASFNLLSDQGARLATQRNVDVESVFGRLKNNWRFRKFLWRGKELANVDWGILFIAHSIAKLAAVWFRQFHSQYFLFGGYFLESPLRISWFSIGGLFHQPSCGITVQSSRHPQAALHR